MPGMASFDRIISELMAKWDIPGGAVSVVKDGRLVLARGYGLADVECNVAVEPDSLFRIGSISKPITAAAILNLVEEGLLELDAKAFAIIDHLQPPSGSSIDPRIQDVTIRQLLQHTAGWERDQSFDPMFKSDRVSRGLGTPKPATCETTIRYMLGQPLDFDPGTKYAYSNFGYCVLGRVVEAVTGRPYDVHVKTKVLTPMGITRMDIGHTTSEGKMEAEVRYYTYPEAPTTRSVFPNATEPVSRPYGGFYLEAMDAHGGWVASAIDLMRFVTALDGSRQPGFLHPDTVTLLVSRPSPPIWVDSSYYYAMGWNVRPYGNDANWWHTGSLPGTTTIFVRTRHGFTWAALFNSRPEDAGRFFGELDRKLWEAVGGVTEWPTHDLFDRYANKALGG